MFEFFEHTADVGFRVHDATLAGALAEAGRALFSLIVENLDAVEPAESVPVRVPKPADAVGELDYVLFDWLAALLQEFESTTRVFSRFDVRVSESGVDAECRGEALDPQRHRLGHEVKAI